MAQLLNTVHGPFLCSRINAGALEHGDLIADEHGTHMFRITGVHRNYRPDVVAVHVGARTKPFMIGINEPVWRAIGARAAGPIS
jgi:hypothetical protein